MGRLVIVESPAKARTIRNFLSDDFIVEACMGHIRDLPPSAKEIPAKYKDKEWSRLGVNVENDFEPLYVIPSDKKKVIRELKARLKEADSLLLATDEDREGESIGWHLVEVLKPKVPVSRMVFHEITSEAIQSALQSPREINQELVRAQETRRILDRLVGYTVSPLLWKKVAPGLSAGRVQSVAVAMLVRREQERLAFRSGAYWDLRASLAKGKQVFTADLVSVGGKNVASGKDFDENTGKLKPRAKVLLLNEEDAKELQERLLKKDWQVTDVKERQQKRQPPPPFITSTLQQEANRKFRFSARDTMRIAQKLYENGYITYMRTDSVTLSSEAIKSARQTVKTRYGEEYLSPKARRYASKSKSAQEAHEAIRPAGTRMPTAEELGLSGGEYKIYDMIWKRTIATQMADAIQRFVTVSITVDDAVFNASGKRIEFPGFFRAYVEGSDDPEAALDDREVILPPLKTGDDVDCKELEALGHETRPPARYTEATLIQQLEKEGVGRPSTYATIISTILERKYASKNGTQLAPTFLALAVNRLMENHFPDLVDTQFTARMEEILDEIATGEADWLPYLRDFYRGDDGLEKRVQDKEKNINPRDIYAMELEDLDAKVRVGRYGAYVEQQTDNGGDPLRASLPSDVPPADLDAETIEELLRQKDEGPEPVGTFPDTDEEIYLLQGPYGHYVQLGQVTEENSRPRRVSLPRNMNPDDVTEDIAIGLLNLPRELGADPETDKKVYAGIGRYGPYVRREKTYKSLTKNDDILTIDLKRALELLSKAKKSGSSVLRELGNHPDDGKKITINDGPYGPYVKHSRTNAALKDIDPKSVTLEQAVKLLSEAKAKKSARRKKKKKKSS